MEPRRIWPRYLYYSNLGYEEYVEVDWLEEKRSVGSTNAQP